MASVADSLRTSSTNITNISKSLFETKRSVSSVNDSVNNISKIISTNTRIKKEVFANSQIIEDRRREATKRKELEDQLESSRVSTSPSRGLAFAGRSDKGPLGRLVGFLGFITAGWIVENLPTWIFMGQEFITRIQIFGRTMYNMVDNMTAIVESFGDILKNSFNAIVTLDFNEFSEGSVAASFDEFNLAIQGLGDEITETFRLFTTPLNESVETGEQAPALDEERPETMFPPAGGPNQDLYTLATITSLESASQQGRADVAQSIYNRMKQRGQSATQVVTAPGQYSPFFASPEAAKKIKTYDDAVNYLVKYKGYTRKTAETMIQSTLSAISNPQLQAEASRFIGARTSFRGSPQNYKSLPNVVFRGSSSDNQFLNEEVVQGGASAVPSFVSFQPSAVSSKNQISPSAATTSSLALARTAERLKKERLDTSRYGRDGCVFAVNEVYRAAGMTPPWGSSVYVPTAREILVKKRWSQVGVKNARPGDIVIMSDRHPTEPWIHIGIVSTKGTVIHNSSTNKALTNDESFSSLALRYVKIEVFRDPLAGTPPPPTTSTPSKALPAQIASLPSRMAQPAAMTPERKGSQIIFIDDTQPQAQAPQVSYPSQQPTVTPTITEFKLLNNFIKNKLLLDLAYL